MLQQEIRPCEITNMYICVFFNSKMRKYGWITSFSIMKKKVILLILNIYIYIYIYIYIFDSVKLIMHVIIIIIIIMIKVN